LDNVGNTLLLAAVRRRLRRDDARNRSSARRHVQLFVVFAEVYNLVRMQKLIPIPNAA
jgi:hypothetical protein